MCTLSWVAREDGYTVVFSRDERRARASGLPPRERTCRGRRLLAPLDPAGGGSWIAVNEAGFTVAVLNRYPRGRTDGSGARSRGLLVTALGDAGSLAELAERLGEQPLGLHAPFALVAVEPGAPVAIHEWDGSRLATRRQAHDGLVLTSSSLDQERAEAARAAAHAALQGRFRRVDEALLDAFHRGHHGPLDVSVCMHREDAGTVSLTRVRVDRAAVTMIHEPGPPCARGEAGRLMLSRQAVPTGRAS